MTTLYSTNLNDLREEDIRDVNKRLIEGWERIPQLFVEHVDYPEKVKMAFALDFTARLMSRMTEAQLYGYMKSYNISLDERILLNRCLDKDTFTDYSPELILQYVRQKRIFKYWKNVYGDTLEGLAKVQELGGMYDYK